LELGWSFLEGIGAALIMPAIVALVAGNFPPRGRPRAYGLVMAAGAIAVAVGPLIGGFATTYFSWRRVFAGEVIVVLAMFVLARRVHDAPPESRPKLDLVGTVLSAAGLGLAIFGVLRPSEWGWIQPRPDGPDVLEVSPTVWLIIGGLCIVALFSSIDPAAGAGIVTVPLLLAGLGIGALASQLGGVTVSAVPDEDSPEVGGLQNTGTNLGASIGTALAGSILIAFLTSSFLTGIQQNPAGPRLGQGPGQRRARRRRAVPLRRRPPSRVDQAGVSEETATAALEANQQARLDGLRAALVVLALVALLALFAARRIPTQQPGSTPG
jgi:MFS family permease